MTPIGKDLADAEFLEYVRKHEPPHVYRYYQAVQNRELKLEDRHRTLDRIELSPAGRAAVWKFAGYMAIVIAIVAAFIFGRSVGG